MSEPASADEQSDIEETAVSLQNEFPDDNQPPLAEIERRLSILIDEYAVPEGDAVMSIRFHFLDELGIEEGA